jgi:HK97 family phage portal protein
MFEKVKQLFGGQKEKGLLPSIGSIKNIFTGGLFSRNEDYLDKYRGWVYRCITLIGNEVSNTELRLYKRVDKNGEIEKVEVTQHELLNLIRTPNPQMTQSEFLEAWVASQKLEGNAFIFRAKAGKITKEMWIMRPDWVKIVPSKTPEKLISGYVYMRNGMGNDEMPVLEEEMIHCKNPNPKYFNNTNPFRGVGEVMASLDIINEDEVIKNWNKKFFENGAQLSGVLEFDGNVGEDEVRRMQAKWDRAYQGSENSNKTAFLQGGLRYKPTGISQRELAFVEQRKLDRDEILGMFGIPKGLILAEDVNLANANTAVWSFTRFTVKPMLKRIEDALNATIVKEYGDNLFFEFDNPVPDDRTAIVDEYVKACGVWLTPNEIREMEGWEEIEGGDKLGRGITVAPAVAEPVIEEEKPEPTKEGEADDETKMLKKKELNDERETKGIKAWDEMIKAQKPFEEKYKGAIERYFNGVRLRVLQEYGAKKEFANTKALDDDAEMKVLLDILSPMQRELFEQQARSAMKGLGVANDFTFTDALKATLKKWDIHLSGGITKTTKNDLQRILGDANAQGLGTDEVTNKLNEYFDYAEEMRAGMIATTETIRIANMASVEGWAQSGVVEAKEWFTAPDDRTCEFCYEMDGKVIGLSDAYFNQGDTITTQSGKEMVLDYSSTDEPPLHVNCRCTLLPVIK